MVLGLTCYHNRYLSKHSWFYNVDYTLPIDETQWTIGCILASTISTSIVETEKCSI